MPTINFDELMSMHKKAASAGVGSRSWIEFSTTMFETFPALYKTAKTMNSESARLRNQVSTGKDIVSAGIDLMTKEQVGQWRGVRSFLEQEADAYETPNS